MRRLLFALLLVILALTSHGRARIPEVRVLLDRVSNGLEYQVSGGHGGRLGSEISFSTSLPLAWPVSVSDESLLVDGHEAGDSLTLTPDAGTVEWNGARYRGSIRFVAEDDQLLVINVLDVESYLRGVISAEMMAQWPLEALKAQAVAARTYTLSELDPLAHYDICATTECQVYEGMRAENPRTDQAVADTLGLVLTFEGELARTYYHSDSGGVTASGAEVWGERSPYLVSRSDVNAATPHRRWRHQLDPWLMSNLLAQSGHHVGKVAALRVTEYSTSGRATRATIEGANGVANLGGKELTDFLRGSGLKSTRFRMIGALLAEGDGWGHGVGLSQYGARQLALSGYDFTQILDFYYPRTTLERLAPERWQN